MSTADLPLEEQATNAQTLEHIQHVRNLINLVVVELLHRGVIHDQSKLGDMERGMYTTFTPKLRTTPFGSDEYKGLLKEMGPALQHHYEHNRHHPEFHPDGVNGMTLIDLVEMLLDWKASTLRSPNGDINRSITVGAERFKLKEADLVQILRNTVRDLGLDRYGNTPT